MLTPKSPVFSHNYHELNDFERILYMVALRPKWDERKRFFFEGCRDLVGQMYIADRRALYDVITRYKPSQCFEVGTFTGGGSTYFLTAAFRDVGAGRLYSLEIDPNRYMLAAGFYAEYLADQNERVKFLLGGDASAFEPYIDRERGVECVFLDGVGDAEQTMAQYVFFEPLFRPGSLLMCHDWDTEKQRLLRPVLENSLDWRCEMHIGKPDSVGFVLYVRR